MQINFSFLADSFKTPLQKPLQFFAVPMPPAIAMKRVPAFPSRAPIKIDSAKSMAAQSFIDCFAPFGKPIRTQAHLCAEYSVSRIVQQRRFSGRISNHPPPPHGVFRVTGRFGMKLFAGEIRGNCNAVFRCFEQCGIHFCHFFNGIRRVTGITPENTIAEIVAIVVETHQGNA